MNKDKELEEAKRRCLKIINDNKEVIKEARKNGDINTMQLTASLDNDSIAIRTILQALDEEKYFNKIYGYHMKYNFIPKKKIEELIENESIDISGFKCISVEDIQELLEDK